MRTNKIHLGQRDSKRTMALSRSPSWKEHRVAQALEIDGRVYSVDFVARRATGVTGWKVSLVYVPRDADTMGDITVDLPNASSTAEVHRLMRELEGDEERLRQLFAAANRARA